MRSKLTLFIAWMLAMILLPACTPNLPASKTQTITVADDNGTPFSGLTSSLAKTTNPGSQSEALALILRDYFNFMNAQEFEKAAEMRVVDKPGEFAPWSKSSFVSNFQDGAKIEYTLLDLQDGHNLTNKATTGWLGSAVFPDENEENCRTFLIRYSLNFVNIIGFDPSGVEFTQKAVLHKQEERWLIHDFVDPGFVACRKADDTWGQGNPTVTPVAEVTSMPYTPRPQLATPTQQPTFMNLSPEETILRYYELENQGEFEQSYLLLSNHSAFSRMGFREYVENQQHLKTVWVLLDIKVLGVCKAGEAQMPLAIPTSRVPEEADCLIYSVKSQLFFPMGWGAVPSGTVLNWNYWLERENGQWRLRDWGMG